ncbi:hypothetical protein DFJ67_4784 [Asanoa ferruginea]|uniref:Uncharacterized protein n=1 Tax=Asanoa ferruginea TaxID=53367 RepID=A0A3D9ZND1_9ACTN|nr:hypothetical protein [Asanoa ferruginea]REF98765.1 hypothetical protein DFJ67_4784 [Asanoa ferruginea]GIF49506.1 hypothetical protein Afe04nite_40450 [Asanoa ferruginea]
MRQILLLASSLAVGWLVAALVLSLITDDSYGEALAAMLPVVVVMAALQVFVNRRGREGGKR